MYQNHHDAFAWFSVTGHWLTPLGGALGGAGEQFIQFTSVKIKHFLRQRLNFQFLPHAISINLYFSLTLTAPEATMNFFSCTGDTLFVLSLVVASAQVSQTP